jgi:hypothetical protein
MVYIQNSTLLRPTEKLIKPYKCSMIATEGPRIMGKIDMEGLEITYDSFYVSQLTLNTLAKNQPLYYGFLGKDITFLLVKATYEPIDKNWIIEEEQYIEYYFGDNPSQTRYMNKLLLLTGNSVHRVPQIYFNNPSETYSVKLEVMMANLPQEDMTYNVSSSPTLSGLYYNSIISDKYMYGSTCSGSSELYVIDSTRDVLMTIPYYRIHSIIKQDNTNSLIIGLDTEEKIILEFLNEYNLNQSNSRINWVLKDKKNRVLDVSEIYHCNVSMDGLDNIDPVIEPLGVSGWTGMTILPYETGTTITKTQLIDYLISSVTDNRDGDISIYNVLVTIRKLDALIPLDNISEEGIYDIDFSVSDMAGNNTVKTARVVVDVTGPVIDFYSYATGDMFTMSISGDTMDSLGITYSDIKSYTVCGVTDLVDDTLTIGDVIITVEPSGNTYITETGNTYDVNYSLTDFVGLTFETGKTMYVIT